MICGDSVKCHHDKNLGGAAFLQRNRGAMLGAGRKK
jgi:hypothetical protein